MANDQQFCLRWNNHQTTLVEIFDKLLSNDSLVDCTLAAEGQYMKAHKVLLSACSPYFELILSQHNDKHPIIILKDVTFRELKALMDYMYRGEVNVSQDQLGALLKVAENLQIKGLSDSGGGGTEPKEKPPEKRPLPPPPPAQQPTPIIPRPGLTIEHRRSNQLDLSQHSPSALDGSPVPRKRKRTRRRSSDDESSLGHTPIESHHDSSSRESSSLSIPPNVASTPLSKSVAVIPEPPPVLDRTDHILPEPAQPIHQDIVHKTEPNTEMLLEPKHEYPDDDMNEDSVEDLTLEDDMNDLDQSQAGPSGEGSSSQGFTPWHMATDRSTDEVFMQAQEAVGAQRDSQDWGEYCEGPPQPLEDPLAPDPIKIERKPTTFQLQSPRVTRQQSDQRVMCQGNLPQEPQILAPIPQTLHVASDMHPIYESFLLQPSQELRPGLQQTSEPQTGLPQQPQYQSGVAHMVEAQSQLSFPSQPLQNQALVPQYPRVQKRPAEAPHVRPHQSQTLMATSRPPEPSQLLPELAQPSRHNRMLADAPNTPSVPPTLLPEVTQLQPGMWHSQLRTGMAQKPQLQESLPQQPRRIASLAQLQAKMRLSSQIQAQSPQLQERPSVPPRLQANPAQLAQLQARIQLSPRIQARLSQLQAQLSQCPQLRARMSRSSQLQAGLCQSPQLQAGMSQSPQLQAGMSQSPQLQAEPLQKHQLQNHAMLTRHLQLQSQPKDTSQQARLSDNEQLQAESSQAVPFQSGIPQPVQIQTVRPTPQMQAMLPQSPQLQVVLPQRRELQQAGSVVRPSDLVVWRGALEWTNPRPNASNYLKKTVACCLSTYRAGSQLGVRPELWPDVAILKLVPSQIMRQEQLKDYVVEAKKFAVHPKPGPALECLSLLMRNDFVGLVYFNNPQLPLSEMCDVMILLPVAWKHSFIGCIPSNQVAFKKSLLDAGCDVVECSREKEKEQVIVLT